MEDVLIKINRGIKMAIEMFICEKLDHLMGSKYYYLNWLKDNLFMMLLFHWSSTRKHLK